MSSTFSDGRHNRVPFGVSHNRPVDQDRMRQHEIDQLVVGPFRIGEAELRIGRAFLAQQACAAHLHGAQQRDKLSRLGGVFRYSMTIGSSPLCRIMASVLREVPQAGL